MGCFDMVKRVNFWNYKIKEKNFKTVLGLAVEKGGNLLLFYSLF